MSPLSFLEASTPGTGGFVESPSQRLGIQHVLPIRTPEDLSKVSVEDAASPMLLGDIAQVKEDHQPLIGDAVVGQDAGLLLVVEKFPGTSTLQVTKDIEAALNDMQPGLSGIQMDTSVFRPASFLQDAVDGLGLALLVSLLIAVLLFWAAVPLLAGGRDRPRGHHHHRHGGGSGALLARLHAEYLDPRRHLAGLFP